jgi:prophage regulatory protein
MNNQYLSVKSLSKKFEVSRATVWRWASTGKLPRPIKLYGSTRWRAADIAAWEEKQEGQKK